MRHLTGRSPNTAPRSFLLDARKLAPIAGQPKPALGDQRAHDLHLFLRRIKVGEALDGTVTEHRAALVPS
jgi:hypothetical protein